MKIPSIIVKHSEGASLAMYAVGIVGVLGAYLLSNLAGQKTGYEQAYKENDKTVDWDNINCDIAFKK